MRLRNIPGADDVITGSPYVIQDGKAMKGKHQESFPCSQPIHIEIGMGKGRFLHELAKQNPSINYIGIERYSSVLLRAIQKMEEDPVENLKFLCMDARELSEVFEEGEVDRIYLNFSDPWPKDRHAKRRLPSREFLNRYDSILKKEGRLEFKTDNKELFEFALEELPFANWKAEAVTYDLHNDKEMCKGNIMTEYEEKFSAKGNPIYKYIIYR
ncbi:MAG: tRNA (guanosine(46)-N7)-methyltransferase TrmB [Lachnospiraceae bacterium]|nr:tRNA (guanosine(46)-N7)-methyltransferase TrmB [Lachnospiraceae bacterium]